jgi:hypothetical protein
MEAGLVENRKIDFLVRFDRAQQYSALRFVLPAPVWKTLRYLNIGSEKVLREDATELRNYVGKIVKEHKSEGDNLLSLYLKTGEQTGKAYMTVR